MSLLNENIDIKIREVKYVSWDKKTVDVAPRPFHALGFRIKGDADFVFEKISCSVYEGEVFLLPANYPYNVTYKNKNELLAVHFYSSEELKPEVFHINNTGVISSLFYKIYEAFEKKEPGYYFKELSLMGEILENISLQQNQGKKGNYEFFNKALEYLELNFTDKELTVEKLVNMSYMSNTYFRKLFYEKYGLTPANYIMKKRLSYGEKLLAKGGIPVSEAAVKSGFSDPKYFSRMIKKEYGVSPSKLYTVKKS